jgi:hypothetical protein
LDLLPYWALLPYWPYWTWLYRGLLGLLALLDLALLGLLAYRGLTGGVLPRLAAWGLLVALAPGPLRTHKASLAWLIGCLAAR